jgi:predicted outer membrane repeat protein
LPNGIAVNGNASSRAFLFGSGTTNTLVAMTLTNCQADEGGAIYLTNSATLTISNATVAGNHATLSGGAILNVFGQLTIYNSTLSGNSAVFNAGCVFQYADKKLLIVNSTFTGNSCANGGGAVEAGNGEVELAHCTITGNASSDYAGGGVTCGEPPFATVTARNSIIAGNSNGDVSRGPGAVGNGFTSLGHNLIGNGDAVESFNQSGDQTNAAPLLAPLANYGGPTLTMPPQPGSGAIDAGTNLLSLPATDQRGFARVVNGTVDIGAVEGVFNPDFALINPTRLGDGTFQFSFSNLNGAGFMVFATTNVALPAVNWSNLGPAVELPPGSGQFQFNDAQATNYLQRFYQVHLP